MKRQHDLIFSKLHSRFSGLLKILENLVERLRRHWPQIKISVRGDCGVASPEMYEFCEREQLEYAFGYAANAVLKR